VSPDLPASPAPIIRPDHTTPPHAADLPRSLLYSISTSIGGPGLATTAAQATTAALASDCLGQAIAYGFRSKGFPRQKARSLAFSPPRLASGLGSDRYYAAKKRYLDRCAARALRSGRFDFFHGWSGEALDSLLAARQQGIPSVLDIPTWHRNQGRSKRGETLSERAARTSPPTGSLAWLDRLAPSRQQMLAEYALASAVLVQSELAALSFLTAGLPAHRIIYVARGADPDLFTQATPPADVFRLTFLGALIERKGVHTLLKAWHQLGLKRAELLLVGAVHPEMEPHLRRFSSPSVKLAGFSHNVPTLLASSSAFAFPSRCEGSAKATFEAAAAGLPGITTLESGDAYVHGQTGIIVPIDDPDALAAAILHLYQNPEEAREMGQLSRQRILQQYTWEHHRNRLLHAYAHALKLPSPREERRPAI
jgi:glycosyltransferase involved in cell wall biosynthesis